MKLSEEDLSEVEETAHKHKNVCLLFLIDIYRMLKMLVEKQNNTCYCGNKGSNSTHQRQLAVDCATQHIREFLAQSVNGEPADFGKVCGSNCPIWRAGRCENFNWLGNLDPITSQSNVKICVCNAGKTNRE